MTTRDDRLRQFFAGYFHQDWDLGGAGSWPDVMDEYLAGNTKDDAIKTCADLRAWLADSGHVQQLPPGFGCEYDPGPDGLDQLTWVARLAEYIERKVGG